MRCAAATSRASVYLFTLNVSVGPRGVLAILTYFEFSVALRMMKCDTPNGPATCTKSLSLFVLDSLRFLAVCGSMTCRTSSVSSFTSSLILPRLMTKDLGMSPLPPGASLPAFWSRCVRRFLRRVFAMAVGSGSSRRARASEENLSAALSTELPNLFRFS